MRENARKTLLSLAVLCFVFFAGEYANCLSVDALSHPCNGSVGIHASCWVESGARLESLIVFANRDRLLSLEIPKYAAAYVLLESLVTEIPLGLGAIQWKHPPPPPNTHTHPPQAHRIWLWNWQGRSEPNLAWRNSHWQVRDEKLHEKHSWGKEEGKKI